jgi:hypothetical protein
LKLPVTDPDAIEQVGAPRKGPPVIAHEVSVDGKPNPVTEIVWPFVPMEGVRVTDGFTVKDASPASSTVPLDGHFTLTVYAAAAPGAVPTVKDPSTSPKPSDTEATGFTTKLGLELE